MLGLNNQNNDVKINRKTETSYGCGDSICRGVWL